jgi:hypothetical protein
MAEWPTEEEIEADAMKKINMMFNWVSVEDRLPADHQIIDVKGKPCGDERYEMITHLEYSTTAGFITNITHWRPHVS